MYVSTSFINLLSVFFSKSKRAVDYSVVQSCGQRELSSAIVETPTKYAVRGILFHLIKQLVL